MKKYYYPEYQKEYYNKNKAHKLSIARNTHYRKQYGITTAEYNILFEVQNGLCAICNQKEEAKKQYGVKRLSVDHCHSTGKVRGLLCYNCNFAIGFFRDNSEVMEQAIKYIKKHR